MKTLVYIRKFLAVIILMILPFVISCRNQEIARVEETPFVKDLNDIRNSGKMVVVTDFNSINYFIYKGQPLGFQYEMLQELSDHLGLEIEVRVNNDLGKNFEDLIDGNVDIIASNLTISKERKELVEFTIPHSQTRQVLVQREFVSGGPFDKKTELIRNPLDLSGKTIYVQKKSTHALRLRNLSDEIGEKINIVEVPIETEQLIKMVAREEIDFF
jgi:membrane-bound lytic murein transglycosylase F